MVAATGTVAGMGANSRVVCWVGLTTAAVVLSGCTGTGGEAETTAGGTAASTACLDAGNLGRGILAGARDGRELSVLDAKAVESPDHDGTYLVALRFGGSPDGDTGVWAAGSLELGDPSVTAVDAGAVQATDWPRAIVSEPKVSMTDPGVAEALACLSPATQ